MKKLLLFCSLGFLLFASSAEATSRINAASVDTLLGQAHLTSRLATDACQRLATRLQVTTIALMSPAQAQEVFEQALSLAIEDQVASIKQVAQRTSAAGAYDRLRADLPTTVALQLIRTCPVAGQLYSRFSNSAAAEDAFIKSWGDELCQRLTALQTKGLLQAKTSTERMALFHQEFNATLTQRGPQIMQLYGPAGNSQQVVGRLGDRITEYMQRQCLPTLMLLKESK